MLDWLKPRRAASGPPPSVIAAGRITLGDFEVHRLGFGAMRLTGRGVWGPPSDRREALRVLRRLPDVGIDFIDTADSYGPAVSEELIREALHPYNGLRIATKGGQLRPGPDQWKPHGRPEYLRECVLGSLKRLGVEQIDLWQLHRIDPAVPRLEQFEVMRDMQREGLVRHVGLSQVNVDDIVAARAVMPIVSVQNQYNLMARSSGAVLDYCTANQIAFIPWYPLGSGKLARSGTAIDALARALGASRTQIAIAWLLKRSPAMLVIPGTSKVAHLDENARAADLELTDAAFQQLDRME